MNEAHLHLILNHLPIIIPVVGILIVIAALIAKSEVVVRTGLLVFVFGALCTFPAMFTGDQAEDMVEELPGVSHEQIHHHEEHAESFALASYILGVVSLFGVWASMKQKSFKQGITYSAIIICVVALFLAQQTGTSGGRIRHPEINEGK